MLWCRLLYIIRIIGKREYSISIYSWKHLAIQCKVGGAKTGTLSMKSICCY